VARRIKRRIAEEVGTWESELNSKNKLRRKSGQTRINMRVDQHESGGHTEEKRSLVFSNQPSSPTSRAIRINAI
jgi:hypothetical protein